MRFNLKKERNDGYNLFVLMAAIVGFGDDPKEYLGSRKNRRKWQLLKELHDSLGQISVQEIEYHFAVNFCAIRYDSHNSAFHPDNFFLISERAVYFEIENDNVWFYWIKGKKLIQALEKKYLGQITCPSQFA